MISQQQPLRKTTCGILWETWDRFWQETSINGVNNAGKARTSYIRRGCWMVIFIVGSYFTIAGVVDVIEDYFKWPVTTSVSVQHYNKVSITTTVYS